MDNIINNGYADISNLLDTKNSWFDEGDSFFDNRETSQPYVLSVPDSGVIGGQPISGASMGFSGEIYSIDGYKRESRDLNNPYNIIPSRNISMKDVDFPVLGIDNLGNSQMMYPENDYTFQGTEVLELPIKTKV